MSSSRSAADKGKGKVGETQPQRSTHGSGRRSSGITINEGGDEIRRGNTTFQRVPNRRQLEDIEEEMLTNDELTQIQRDEQLAKDLQNEEMRSRRCRATIQGDDVEEDEDEDEDIGSAASITSKRILSSEIFTVHFKKVEMVTSGITQIKAFCNYCDKVYIYKPGNGYGTYRKHFPSKHAAQMGKDRSQSQLNFQAGQQGLFEAQLFKYNEMVARNEMAKLCAQESYPFGFADSEGWENRQKKTFNPAIRKFSRASITRKVVELSNVYKLTLRSMFKNIDHRVSIAAYTWADYRQKNDYMGLTVHWVDRSWTLNKRLIAFKKFNIVHTADNITICIIKILKYYNILDKVFSISFDNASANTASVPALIQACDPLLGGKLFHCRCICHILNLCVKDGMTILYSSIKPIRNAINYLHDRTKLFRAWSKLCKRN